MSNQVTVASRKYAHLRKYAHHLFLLKVIAKGHLLLESTPTQQTKIIIGASLSEPHIDEYAVEFVCIYYIYHTSCRKSLPALILRVLATFVNSKLFTNYLYSTQREDTNRLATARIETTRGPTY